jgi:hypothetical protein
MRLTFKMSVLKQSWFDCGVCSESDNYAMDGGLSGSFVCPLERLMPEVNSNAAPKELAP